MKPGDLITLIPGVPTTTYLSEINNPEGFMGLVISFTPGNGNLGSWYNEIFLTLPNEAGRIFRLLLTDEEIENNFMVIS